MTILTEYIQKQLRKGHPLHRIKQKLIEAGHDVSLIEQEISRFEQKEENKIVKILKKHQKISTIIITTILLILGIIFISKMINFDMCKNAQDKDNCYARNAMNTSDIKYCLKIQDSVIKTACETQLWTINRCAYMQKTRFSQQEINDCQRQTFIQSLR